MTAKQTKQIGNQTRKAAEQIKEEILSHLKKGPISTKKLSDLLQSNWSTTNNYLEELSKEGKVREIYSRENLKVYVRSDYPVFYGLALDDKKLNDSLFLLSKIIEKWQEVKKETINKTTMQEIAVNIVKKCSLDIPIVRFHYGKVLATYLEPEKYKETIAIYRVKDPTDSDNIIKAIKDEIKNGEHSNIAWKEKKKQYKQHSDMKIFNVSDDVSYILSKNTMIDTQKILDHLYNFLLEMPTSEKYSLLFKQYHDFIGLVNFILHSKEFKEGKEEDKESYLKEIADTFNSLWKTLTTVFFFEDIEYIINEEFQEITQCIKDSRIKTYSFEIEEKLNNLSEYKKTLTPQKVELNEDEKKIIEILLEGANEE